MAGLSPVEVNKLVESDRVHRSVYTSQEIFDQEMRLIFGQAWVYVGHDSQVPNPGDYFTTRIGLEDVVMVRGKDGAINVLYNRCPHKGAKLVSDGCGHVGPLFMCPYHAWTFKLDGAFNGAPHRHGYKGTAFDPADPQFSMKPVARVDSHRGFVFANLSAKGPDLKTFLGGAITSLDNFADRAPAGEVEVAGGVQRVMQRSNWKIFFENLNDTGHPQATHESSFMAARATVKEKMGGEVPFQLHIIEGNGEPNKFWEGLDLRSYDYGHSYMTAIFNPPRDKISLEYIAQLEAVHGAEKAQAIVSMNRHNTILYPSCSPHTGFQQLRVIRPISINRTMVEIFTFRLKGTSDDFFQRTITYTNIVNSPSSVVMIDDVEVYERCQEGMQLTGSDWISQHRRAGFEERVADGYAADGISEMPIRNQFRAWKQYMSSGEQ
jgi:phenylpropionate dioxygenase-like ring-hydroxylating dioxygenase large terminal subunit